MSPKSLERAHRVVSDIWHALPEESRESFIEGLIALFEGKPTEAARIAEVHAQTLMIRSAAHGGKLPT